ncbi:DUF1918 domain-containing protein [Dactylosporangium sp. NPDC049742]|uniref:DUF1918 domain-containing protein n=1 Tax=Dactylosporangium sp. NPDC049742 TaxID=3154737 RepID=UPI003447B758
MVISSSSFCPSTALPQAPRAGRWSRQSRTERPELRCGGTAGGGGQRIGAITGIGHADHTPPCTVRRLDNGHEALVFPGPDAG